MPLHRMMNSKVCGGHVTRSDLNQTDAIVLDPSLMQTARILANERVVVWNATTGDRFETYAVTGDPAEICVNGVGARTTRVDDRVVLLTFVDVAAVELARHRPVVVMVDDDNRPVVTSAE
jgi:aspartate 1-decarboxylase